MLAQADSIAEAELQWGVAGETVRSGVLLCWRRVPETTIPNALLLLLLHVGLTLTR